VALNTLLGYAAVAPPNETLVSVVEISQSLAAATESLARGMIFAGIGGPFNS
jgi:hypothetical protein